MSNRRIESPDLNSDIELAPSGTKRAKVSHNGGIIIGSNSNDADNVKLHRAGTDKLEIVIGSDTTPEGVTAPAINLVNLGMKGIVVTEVAATEVVVGTSTIASENAKIRRGGAGKIEVVTADEATAEGTPTYSKRTEVGVGSVVVGASTTPANNIKLRRGAAGKLEFVQGSDTTGDGAEAIGTKVDIFSRSISLGSGADGSGAKIFRSGIQELEVTSEDSPTTDGSRHSLYRGQINYRSAVVGASATESQNIKLHRGGVNELEFVKGDSTLSENVRATSKSQINASDIMLGADATLANNGKIHRGASQELEVVIGSSHTSETDGTRSSNKAQLNVNKLSVGSASDVNHAENVKLHRGGVNELEVVEADDATADSSRSANKAQINAKDVQIGSDAVTVGNNVKLHRSGNSEVEFVTGSANASTLDGTAYSSDRASVAVGSLDVGKDATATNNAKLHRNYNTNYGAPEAELEVVASNDGTADGIAASSGRRNLNVKGLTVGQSSTASENVKLHRGSAGIVEVVTGNDITVEGSPSTNKAQLSAKVLQVGNDATVAENIKLRKAAPYVMQVVQGDDTTAEDTHSTLLSQLSFKFETHADGSEESAVGQEGRGFWNSTFKQLEVSNGASWKVIGENKASNLVENAGFSAVTSSNTMVVTLLNQSGSSPDNGDAVRAAFRDPSASSSAWYFRKATTAQSLTIPSGATLGTSNALAGRVYVYLIDQEYYGGNIELAVSQKYFPANSVVSTTAISAAATSPGVVYSTNARISVAVACIGYFESTQATAGTWASNPSASHVGDLGPRDNKLMGAAVAGPGDIATSAEASQTVTTKAAVTDLDVSLTTTGRPVRLQLIPGSPAGSSTPGKLQLSQTGADFYITGSIFILRDSVEIAVFELEEKYINDSNKGITFSPSCIDFLDDVGAGVYNYTISAEASSTNGLLDISNVKLIAYEL